MLNIECNVCMFWYDLVCLKSIKRFDIDITVSEVNTGVHID